MKLELDINVNLHLPGVLPFLQNLKGLIMSTQAEIAQGLTDLTAQVAKIGVESATTLQLVTDLQAVIDSQAGGVSPELQTAFDALKAQVKVVDDLVPDPVV